MTLKGHLSDVTTVQFFPSNLVVLTGGSDFLLKIWSVLNGSNPVTLQGHTSGMSLILKKMISINKIYGYSNYWHCYHLSGPKCFM